MPTTRRNMTTSERRAGESCPTSSGPFRCSRPFGHTDECVTRQRAPVHVGPAASSAQVRAALALAAAHAQREASMLRELRVLRARAVDAAQEAIGGPDVPRDG